MKILFLLLTTLFLWMLQPFGSSLLKAEPAPQPGTIVVAQETLIKDTYQNSYLVESSTEETSALDAMQLNSYQFNTYNPDIVTHGFQTGEALGYRGGRAIKHHVCTIFNLECAE